MTSRLNSSIFCSILSLLTSIADLLFSYSLRNTSDCVSLTALLLTATLRQHGESRCPDSSGSPSPGRRLDAGSNTPKDHQSFRLCP